jgi:hypothetical protein
VCTSFVSQSKGASQFVVGSFLPDDVAFEHQWIAVDPTEAAEQRALEMRLERTLAYVTGLPNVRDFIPFPRGLKNRHQIAAA